MKPCDSGSLMPYHVCRVHWLGLTSTFVIVHQAVWILRMVGEHLWVPIESTCYMLALVCLHMLLSTCLHTYICNTCMAEHLQYMHLGMLAQLNVCTSVMLAYVGAHYLQCHAPFTCNALTYSQNCIQHVFQNTSLSNVCNIVLTLLTFCGR